MKWKVVFVGPTGAATTNAAFGLLYPFPTPEEAEAHAACFRTTGMQVEVRTVTENHEEKPGRATRVQRHF
jgi:hypothetical protein